MNNVQIGEKVGTARVSVGAWAEGEGAYLRDLAVKAHKGMGKAVGELHDGYKAAVEKAKE